MTIDENIINKINSLPTLLASLIYVILGKSPWSFGYYSFKKIYIKRILEIESVMDLFKNGKKLDSHYGYGLDERVVEYPWVLSKLNMQKENVLDAGSALNHDFIINQSVFSNKNLHIMTLAPESRNYIDKGVSYLFEDLRKIPIKNNFYDVVISISTLEHIGFDNSFYIRENRNKEINSSSYISAVKELKRVLKPGGNLILTLPFGKPLELSTQLIFDKKLLKELIDSFSPVKSQLCFYKYDQKGWQVSNANECSGAEFNTWIAHLPEFRSKKIPKSLDNAAAARAIVCAILKKEG